MDIIKQFASPVIILLVTLFWFNSSISQNYYVKNYSAGEGFANKIVYDVTQDSSGFIWFATADGIVKYDGFKYSNFEKINYSPAAGYCRLKYDSKNVLWALPLYTYDTIIFCKDSKWQSVRCLTEDFPGLFSEYIGFDLFYDGENPIICAVTPYNIFVLTNDKWKKYSIDNNNPDFRIHSVKNKADKFFICSDAGISILKGNDFDTSLNNIIGKKNEAVLAVEFEKNESGTEKLWLLGNTWLGFIENEKFDLLTDIIKIPVVNSFYFPSLIIDKRNKIYFGNNWAKYFINRITREIQPLTKENGFTTDGTTSIFADRENNIWISDLRGVDKINSFDFQNFTKFNGLLESEVSAIIERKPGELIFGHNSGLSILKEKKIRTIDFKVLPNYDYNASRVLDLKKDKTGNVWIAASIMGLGRLSESGQIDWFKRKNDLVNSVFCSDNGEIYVLTTSGVYLFRNNIFELLLSLSQIQNSYRKIYEIDGTLYIVGTGGIYTKSNGIISKIKSNESHFDKSVYSLFKDSKGQLLVGTSDGLYKIYNDSLVFYNENNFSINNFVYTIFEDRKSNVWFGTNEGVIKKQTGKNQMIYTVLNGLAGNEINRSAGIEDSYGRIWIGSDKGVSCYVEEFNNVNPVIPKLILLDATDLNGNKYSLYEPFEISNSLNTLYFNFRGLSYVNEDLLEYRVKLDGFDKDFIRISQRELANVRYTNLKSGDYKLIVQTRNLEGDWSPEVSSAVITIKKPFYSQLWFVLFTVIVLVPILLLLYKYFIVRDYNKRLNKEIGERKKAEENLRQFTNELQALNVSKDKLFSIVAHDLRSPFQGLLGYSELLENGFDNFNDLQKKEYICDISKLSVNLYELVNKLLQWSQIQTGRIVFEPVLLNINQVIESALNSLHGIIKRKNIEVINEIKDNIFVIADELMITQVIQNLISNALKFSFKKGQIKISSIVKNDFIDISFSDNGTGIPANVLPNLFKIDSRYKSKGTDNEEGTGLGLILCYELIEKNNGTIKAESTDGKGSKFTISLPKSKKN